MKSQVGNTESAFFIIYLFVVPPAFSVCAHLISQSRKREHGEKKLKQLLISLFLAISKPLCVRNISTLNISHLWRTVLPVKPNPPQ